MAASDRTTVWTLMQSTLDSRGFQQYQGSTTVSEDDDTQETDSNDVEGPLTIIQLIRSMARIPIPMSDYPTNAFWNSSDLAAYLEKIWQALEAALRKIDPVSHSIVSWSFFPPARDAQDVSALISLARQMAPDLYYQEFTPRPRSPYLVQPKSLESATFNMIGIVRTHKNLAYGDFLSSLLTPRYENQTLFKLLDEQIDEQDRLSVTADRDTPIPALLSRVYRQFGDERIRDSGSLSVQDFLRLLETQNNLSGLSDQALSKRLVASLKRTSSEKKPWLPTGIQKLLDTQIKTLLPTVK
jgi:hypothetical protein